MIEKRSLKEFSKQKSIVLERTSENLTEENVELVAPKSKSIY